LENQEVRILTLPAMRVASFYAFSASPETDSWSKCVSWVKSHACWQNPPATRIFGFNNPDPSAGSPNYGYEFWLTIGPEVKLENEIKIKELPVVCMLSCSAIMGKARQMARIQSLQTW
jgi:hypothetical protein